MPPQTAHVPILSFGPRRFIYTSGTALWTFWRSREPYPGPGRARTTEQGTGRTDGWMDGRIVQRTRWWVAAGQGRRSGGDMFLSGEASAGNDPWSKPWKHWDAPGADKRGTGDGSGARRVAYCVPPSPCGGLCCLLPVGIGIGIAAGSSLASGVASRSLVAVASCTLL